MRYKTKLNYDAVSIKPAMQQQRPERDVTLTI